MSVIEKLDSVLAAIDALKIEAREGFDIRAYLRMASSVERACYDHLRDHGPAIRQAMIDAEKWKRWEPWLRKQNRVPFNLAKDLDARLASDSEGGDQNG